MSNIKLDKLMSVVLINNLASVLPEQQRGRQAAEPGISARPTLLRNVAPNLADFEGGNLVMQGGANSANPIAEVALPEASQPLFGFDSNALQLNNSAPGDSLSDVMNSIPSMSAETIRDIAWNDGSPNDLTLFDISMFTNMPMSSLNV